MICLRAVHIDLDYERQERMMSLDNRQVVRIGTDGPQAHIPVDGEAQDSGEVLNY